MIWPRHILDKFNEIHPNIIDFACQHWPISPKCLLNINCVLILLVVPISGKMNVLPHCIRTDCHGLYFYWNKECVMKSDYIQRLIFLSWRSVVFGWCGKPYALPVLCTKRAWMSKLAVAKMATPVICWATVNTTTCHVMGSKLINHVLFDCIFSLL